MKELFLIKIHQCFLLSIEGELYSSADTRKKEKIKLLIKKEQ